MNESLIHLQNPYVLRHLLWLLPLVAGLYLYARARRARNLRAFAGENAVALFREDRLPGRSGWRAALLLLSTALLVGALARPGWTPQPMTQQQKGRDVVFLLDVSRSMLAQDMRPSRLERAKLAIEDCIEKLQGDRVGLVVFAGSAQTLCPLTTDYSFLRLALEEAGPRSVDRGGTVLCDAIRKANSLLKHAGNRHRDIILITDGGDDETGDESATAFARQAANEAAAADIRIISIGIGDEKTGQRIPLTDASGKRIYLQHNGQDVRTRLNAPLLRQVASATRDGKYVNAGTGDFDLGALYAAIVGNAEKNTLQEQKAVRYPEKFQLLLLAALLLLFLEPLIRERSRKTARPLPPATAGVNHTTGAQP